MTTTPQPVTKGKILLYEYSEVLRNRHYSLRTEETYISWARQYILFHNKRHPRDMGAKEINDFISHLVSQRKVSASTQNQALSAILFLYRHVLRVELDESLLFTIRPSKPKRVPTVLSREEARNVINQYKPPAPRQICPICKHAGHTLAKCPNLDVKRVKQLVEAANKQEEYRKYYHRAKRLGLTVKEYKAKYPYVDR